MDAHAEPWLQHGPGFDHTPPRPPPARRDSDGAESLDLLDGYVYGDYSETPNDSSQLPPQPSPPHHYHQHTSSQAPPLLLPRRESSLQNQYHHHQPQHAYSQSESSWAARQPPSRLPSPGHARSQTFDAVNRHPPTIITTHIIKRKPLSSTASPLATRYYSQSSSPTNSCTYSPGELELELPKPETRFSRNSAIDSPTLYDYSTSGPGAFNSDIEEEEGFTELPAPLHPNKPTPDVDPLDDRAGHIPRRNTPDQDQSPAIARVTSPAHPSQPTPESAPAVTLAEDTRSTKASPAFTSELVPDQDKDDVSESAYSRKSNGSSIMSIVAPKPTPPHLNLERVENASDISTPATTIVDHSRTPEINKPLPKSPSSSKFGNFFGWAISPSPSTTEFSSLPSPLASKPGSTDDSVATSYLYRKGSKTNASSVNPLGFLEANLLTPPPAPTPTPPAQIQEMEDELKAISAELAASIRREMDLEDLVDRLQSEISNPQAPSKRTSDYFSDSGVSSTKFSEYDQNKEEVEKIQRRAEQEKASITLELTNKVQEERTKRKVLDQQIKELSEKASQIDLAAINSVDASGRVKELENTCDDLRRRLSEEKTVKNNFEDLLSAIRGELEEASNERDNLRDEVVPQLKARVEGLEAEASEYANLTYESTKMQQELQTLKSENKNLRNTRQPNDDPPSSRSSIALSRSNSMTAGLRSHRAPNGLTRSNTVKGGVESREALSDRLKDVEAQRDALHNALRNLLDRQEFQNRENEKKIKSLELEKERLLAMSPGKAGFEKDVGNLRNEIKVLRRRAEDAVEHKWQAEKGLAGLKMDLDRAEEEIASLRALLQEKDILIPPSLARSSSESAQGNQSVTSESLSASFKELQTAYQQSLERIKTLETSGPNEVDSEKTQLAIQRLEQALASAIAERDAALQEAATYKTQFDGLHESEAQHVGAERALADELRDSARRIEELATQVRQQLAANANLRQRLTDTVARGDAERKGNVERITSLQGRLRVLEEQVIAAQSASEDRVARHEEQIRELQEANNLQLKRGPLSPLSRDANSPRPGLSPLPSPMFPRSPRSPRRMPKMTIEDEVQVDKLRSRVSDLERALAEADTEMQEVIARMSEAQIEVLTLQEEREAAVRETRKLQRILDAEKVKAFEDRFRTLSGNV